MHGIVSRLLDLSRLESGKAKVEFVESDFGQVIQESVQDLKGIAEQNQTTLSTKGFQNQTVCCDPLMLRQLVTNLASNAIRFSNSDVAICWDKKSIDDQEVIELRVKDDGPGISQEDQKRLFNKFVQIKRKGDAAYKGTGLGLVICKEIMKLHHGDIFIESKEGQGATFVCRFPQLHEDNLTQEQ
ncbi:MAG: HAMP domain-containing histidine kinase [Deltaproteobacteria bacterium]|nr:HAMP domain-containing histidine kinase [Deltaproteobacteria bacterium]